MHEIAYSFHLVSSLKEVLWASQSSSPVTIPIGLANKPSCMTGPKIF